MLGRPSFLESICWYIVRGSAALVACVVYGCTFTSLVLVAFNC